MKRKLKYLFFIVLVTLSLGQYANILQGYQLKLYLFDIFIGIYTFIALFLLLKEKKPLILPVYLFGFLLFSLVALVSLTPVLDRYGLPTLLKAVAYLFRWLIYVCSGIVTYNLVKQKIISIGAVLTSFVYSGLFVALAGFVQLLFLPDFTVLDPMLGWDPHKNRLASTFFDPNFAGGYLVLIVSLMIFKKNLLKLKAKHYRLILYSLLLGLFFTYSRSAWGMFGIVIFFYGLRKNIWLILSGFLLAFSAYFAVPRIQTRIAGITDPADSAHFRLISWKETLRIYNDNKFLGVGYNALEKAKVEYGYISRDNTVDHSASGSDSSFLLVLATTGILGFSIFLISYFLPLFKEPDFFKLAFILGLFLQTQFINALFYPQIMFLWITVFSLLCI